jgi:hypothetical protein
MRSGLVRVDSRSHGYLAEGQTEQAPDAAHPSSLDYLLGSLACDLILGLEREARRAGASLDAIEASLSARLDNPLVALGVIGEQGNAGIAGIRGSIYVSGEVPEPALRECWEKALRSAPVYATLSQCVPVDVAMQIIL